MPSPPEDRPAAPAHPRSRRRGVISVAYWLVAAAVYAGAGALYPPAFLLGFQESVLYVLAVSVLAPKVIDRLS